jgi:hypothetical protein
LVLMPKQCWTYQSYRCIFTADLHLAQARSIVEVSEQAIHVRDLWEANGECNLL